MTAAPSVSLDEFTARLAVLGATDDEIAAVREHWSDFDDEWTPELRAALVAFSDQRIVDMLRENRDEYTEHTTTIEQQHEVSDAYHRERARAEAFDVIGRPVGEVLAWVGDDHARAEAVISLESEAGDGPRKTLVEPLRQMLAAGDDASG